jgi:hypothetical protein
MKRKREDDGGSGGMCWHPGVGHVRCIAIQWFGAMPLFEIV